jgi:pimeloyl-ACP methyl ester carboxylesterase
MVLPVAAREMMTGAYDSRATIEATVDNVLTAKPLPGELREQVIADSLKGAPAAKLAWPRETSQEDITEQVGNIDVPTIVIAGELDKVDAPDVLRAELLPRVAGTTIHVLAGTGHLSMLESPSEVAALIRSFCERLIL